MSLPTRHDSLEFVRGAGTDDGGLVELAVLGIDVENDFEAVVEGRAESGSDLHDVFIGCLHTEGVAASTADRVANLVGVGVVVVTILRQIRTGILAVEVGVGIVLLSYLPSPFH